MEEESVIDLNYDSPTEIRTLLEMMGLGPRKKWSQNFLINRGAREKLVNSLHIRSGHRVWEIGPGLGAITRLILDQEADLTVFEIDPGYVEYLKLSFKDEESFNIIQGDVLKTWENVVQNEGKPDSLIANLPYNAASAIIASFIEKDQFPNEMSIIVQSEMADRIKSSPGRKSYSSFSVLCQYACNISSLGSLGASSFYPKPNVASKMISMKPHNKFKHLENRNLFFILVRDCFASRRKTLQNNLKNAAARRLQQYGSKILFQAFEDEGISLSTRAEMLTVDQFVAVANRIHKMFENNDS